jgi:hypothetical protein
MLSAREPAQDHVFAGEVCGISEHDAPMHRCLDLASVPLVLLVGGTARFDTTRSLMLTFMLLGMACSESEQIQDGSVEMHEPDNDAALDAGPIDASEAEEHEDDAGSDGGQVVDLSSCKRGVAYGYHSMADLTALRPGVHWWYNWASKPDSKVASSYRGQGFEFVPMAWDEQATSAGLQKDIAQGSARTLLGFNEPNFFAQANLSAADAAARWPELEKVADARGLKLASPAVNFCGPENQCHDTDPFDYLDAFFAACKDCRVDYVAAHWYACDGPALTWYLGELKKYQKPIWLTEFSCLDGQDKSVAVQKKYMTDALAILEADPDVARYSWFIGRSESVPSISLLAEDGKLTELGKLYVSLPHDDPKCSR